MHVVIEPTIRPAIDFEIIAPSAHAIASEHGMSCTEYVPKPMGMPTIMPIRNP